MPSVPTLLLVMLAGLLIMFVFAFTIVGIVGELIALTGLLVLVGHGVRSLVRAARRPSART